MVTEYELKEVMLQLRNFRQWIWDHQIDPWAVRQGLIMALELDTKAAIQRGIKPYDLTVFDFKVKSDMKEWKLKL